MFGPNNDFPQRVSLRDGHDIASSTLVQDCPDSSVVAFVGHSLVDGRIDLYDDLISRLILVQQLAQSNFAAFSRFFRQETPSSRTKTF